MNGIINILISNLHTRQLLYFIPNTFMNSLFSLFGAWSFLKVQPALTNSNEPLEQECSRTAAFLLPSNYTSIASQAGTGEVIGQEEPTLLQKFVLVATGLLCNQCLYLSSASNSIFPILLWIAVVWLSSGPILCATFRSISKGIFNALYLGGLALHAVVLFMLMQEKIALTSMKILILGSLSKQKLIALMSIALNAVIFVVVNSCPDWFFREQPVYFHRLFSAASF